MTNKAMRGPERQNITRPQKATPTNGIIVRPKRPRQQTKQHMAPNGLLQQRQNSAQSREAPPTKRSRRSDQKGLDDKQKQRAASKGRCDIKQTHRAAPKGRAHKAELSRGRKSRDDKQEQRGPKSRCDKTNIAQPREATPAKRSFHAAQKAATQKDRCTATKGRSSKKQTLHDPKGRANQRNCRAAQKARNDKQTELSRRPKRPRRQTKAMRGPEVRGNKNKNCMASP